MFAEEKLAVNITKMNNFFATEKVKFFNEFKNEKKIFICPDNRHQFSCRSSYRKLVDQEWLFSPRTSCPSKRE